MEQDKQGRLTGKVALITGGAGNIGEVITRRYLQEGATVIITGRNTAKLEAYKTRLIDEQGFEAAKIYPLVMDGANLTQVQSGLQQVSEKFGQIDVLVNNAGSAGPKQPLTRVPFNQADLDRLREAGFADTETLGAAFGNLFGITWNLIRAAYPYLSVGASVINVSTIFSRTNYYGRIPYVVPKAALNALSLHLARELGQSEKAVRLNTIYPGPIDSERIRTVFKAMDGLKKMPEGTTASEFFGIMRLKRPDSEGKLAPGFPKTLDVANTAVFLGSDEAIAFAGHPFEVTNGMDVETESKSTLLSRPSLLLLDSEGKVMLVAAGDESTVEAALYFARMQTRSGAQVALCFRTRDAITAARAQMTDEDQLFIHTYGLDPAQHDSIDATFHDIETKFGHLNGALILPGSDGREYGTSLLNIGDEGAANFVERELVAAITLSTYLARFWRDHADTLTETPRVVFVSNPDDGAGNLWGDVLRAGIEQLCRVWRHEESVNVDAGSQKFAVWSNQVIRFSNNQPENSNFAAAWTAKLLNQERKIEEINLYLPVNLTRTMGADRSTFNWTETIFGLHLGKVALITGGSAGIGGQIGRLLALSGAKVVLAARHLKALEDLRASIIQELREIGYGQPEKRVVIVPDCDVADEAVLGPLVETTLAAFGRIDYLVNNAGVSGAEEMIIDMPLDSWRYTLRANLISNYSLIRKVAPLMKKQGSGYIVEVSSYFGGEKYVAVPYPNRGDYAVSKAGQRALVEMLARFLGPEVQINAIAPGPVDGIRLQGSDGKPGLYQRRGRLILEGKRLNDLYTVLIETYRTGSVPVDKLLAFLATNSPQQLSQNPAAPPTLVKMAKKIIAGTSQAAAYSQLMNAGIAKKLIARLELGGYIADKAASQTWLANLPTAPEPFFGADEIEREAIKIGENTLGMMNLNRMPTEQDVALATIFYLADRNVSGETFHPSGGLRFDRTVTEGELFGKPGAARLEKFYNQTVFLLAEDHLRFPIERLAHSYLDEHAVGKLVILTRTLETAQKFCQHFEYYHTNGRFVAFPIGEEIEAGLEKAIKEYGKPIAVVSTPPEPLPQKPLVGRSDHDWAGVFDEKDFARLIEDHLTYHFRVARKMSLVDDCQIVLVTPETNRASVPEEFGLANFIKTSLHAFTVTLGVESERNVHHVPVNQVDLTRRARSEEPVSPDEENEEVTRFVNAVLLTSAPLPDFTTSRYRSRIYRGNAITV